MPFDLTTASICTIVADALTTESDGDVHAIEVTADSCMGFPTEWDSLGFVSVFIAIGAGYDLELDDDDAIHFQSIVGIEAFLRDVLDP
jgi:acyl carrier protein